MAANASRFVIIDGVQIERTRAVRLGYIDEKGKVIKRKGKITPNVEDAQPEVDDADPDVELLEEGAGEPSSVDAPPSTEEPSSTRSRSSASARRG